MIFAFRENLQGEFGQYHLPFKFKKDEKRGTVILPTGLNLSQFPSWLTLLRLLTGDLQ